MPLQYNEFYNKNTGLTIGVEKLLFSRQSEYQLVEVYETDTWGNLLTIDGMVMLSERDEFVYHEMLAHVAMFSHPAPKRVRSEERRVGKEWRDWWGRQQCK